MKPLQLHRHRVAVVIDNRAEYGRRAIRGVIDFANARGDWEILYDFYYGSSTPASSLVGCDGLITQLPRLMRLATREPWGKAKVGVFFPPRTHNFPIVCENNVAIGEIAVAYLANLGFKQLGMCAESYVYAALRQRGFLAAAAKHRLPKPNVLVLSSGLRQAPWQQRLPMIQRWLSELQTPVGLFAANDSLARLVLAAARQGGMLVPEQVAVLGVDDDEMICRLTSPALSSIDHGAYQVGYEAAAILDRIMRGHPPPATPLIVPPVGVVTRRSTESLAIADPDVAMAVRSIRQKVRDGVKVSNILKAVPISRTKLEREFRKLFGRSINQEILRCRVELAKEELMRGKAGILDVALRCGFANRQHLNVVFKNLTGETPTKFRARFEVEPSKESHARIRDRVG